MQFSDEQIAIIEAYNTHTDNLIVNACPGSGKTTLLEQLWRENNAATLAIAFNVSIVKELQARLPQRSNSGRKTLNSFGHGLCLKHINSKLKLDKFKVSNIIRATHSHKWNERDEAIRRYDLTTLVAHLKNIGLAPNLIDNGLIKEVMYQYDIDTFPDIEECAIDVYKRSLHDTRTIDFADQLLFPVLYNVTVPEFDNVLVDEAQDLNNVQIELLNKLHSRFVFVGDRHQSIYAFSGSLPSAMEDISTSFNCTNYPMTLSYRCPLTVVREAQRYYPDDIRCTASALEGRISTLTLTPEGLYTDGSLGAVKWLQDDLILCRQNRPLVDMAYSLLRNNIPCYVRGRDIGENLIRYIKRFKQDDISPLLDAINRDIDTSIALASKREDDDKIAALIDKQKTLEAFIDNIQPVDTSQLCEGIAALFKQGRGTQLSTIHKAKGLEADRVFILDPVLLAQKRKGQKPYQTIQENNIAYVAVTRAKDTLYYFNAPKEGR